MTSSSRIEPPGWMIAVTPASSASLGPSANGKNASEASDEAVAALDPVAAHRDLHGVHAAHLAGADPERRLAVGEDDRVGLHVPADAPGEEQVAPLGLGRLPLGDDLQLGAVGDDDVAVLHEQAAVDLADVEVGVALAAALLVLEDPHVRLLGEDRERVLVVAGRDEHLDELLGERLGELDGRRAC